MRTKVVEVWCALVMSAVLAGCADHNFDWENARCENPEYNYIYGFEQMYGAIDPDQSWDFSAGGRIASTRAGETTSITHLDGLDFGINSKDQVTNNTTLYNHIKNTLKDGDQHTGKEVVLTAPGNGFTIYPVTAQGGYTYDLYIKVGDESEQLVFHKGISDSSRPVCNGMHVMETCSTCKGTGLGWFSKCPTCGGEKKVPTGEPTDFAGIHVEAPVGTPIQLYLKNIKNGNSLVTSDARGTGTGNAIFVSTNIRPEGIPAEYMPENAEIKYIGVEDQSYGDRDYNDLLLILIGNPEVPHELEITGNEYDVPVIYDKRYLVEDMGFAMPGSDAVKFGYTDIDFNDIVIDFSYTVTTHHSVTKTNGVITSDVTTTSTSPTTATIRALGGTWDFVLSLKNSDNSLTPLFWKKESRKVARTESEVGIDLPAIVPNKYYPLWSEETSDGEVTENFEKFNVGTIYNTGLSSTTRGDNHHVMVAGKKTQGQNLIDQTGWDESWLCKISNVQGWDYNANNLVFTLIDSQADEWHLHDLLDSNTDAYNVYFKTNPDYQFAFPAIGACPKIVAFDTNKQWKIERNPVNKEWFERTTMSTENIPYDYNYGGQSELFKQDVVLANWEAYFMPKSECNMSLLQAGKKLVFHFDVDVPLNGTPEVKIALRNNGSEIASNSLGETAQDAPYSSSSSLELQITDELLAQLLAEDSWSPIQYLFTMRGAYSTLKSITVE